MQGGTRARASDVGSGRCVAGTSWWPRRVSASYGRLWTSKRGGRLRIATGAAGAHQAREV